MLARLAKTAQSSLLIIAYPVVIYLLLENDLAWLGTLLVFSMITWKLYHRKNWLWWSTLLLASVLISVQIFGIDAALKMSPAIIHAGLLSIFSQSLASTPLIERFARLDFDDKPPPEIVVYCRKLTIIWALFFTANIAGCVWLAIYGDDATWVLYNGLIIYMLIAALLVGEYLWRRIAFPNLEFAPLTKTIQNVVKSGHQSWGVQK
ncbi:TPA: hypothetical protein EYN23_26760 [Candidatus Poribacteria bacterium]|jgi:uncharacterized membrane protein|nr:hypothetical protein [Candidatus Poribacteria bacterium]